MTVIETQKNVHNRILFFNLNAYQVDKMLHLNAFVYGDIPHSLSPTSFIIHNL